MKAACTNSVRDNQDPHIWHYCDFKGEVKSLDDECPRCLRKCQLAPWVESPLYGER